jgi:phenylalanine-4-hydroxylase
MLPGCYEEDSAKATRKTLLFTIEDKPGALDACLKVFKDSGLNLKHIVSHPSKTFDWDYEFTVELEMPNSGATQGLIMNLEKAGAKCVQLVGGGSVIVKEMEASVPWFPRKLTDLDAFATKTLEYGADLSADHPGFTDEVYRKRRSEITAIAKAYRTYLLFE